MKECERRKDATSKTEGNIKIDFMKIQVEDVNRTIWIAISSSGGLL
jgi:hypothetical protein